MIKRYTLIKTFWHQAKIKQWKATVLLAFVLLIASSVVFAQKKGKLPATPVICPAKFEDQFSRVNIPKDNLQAYRSRLENVATAEFDITFGPGAQTNQAARDAFQFALDIWATQIVSSVPIKIYVDFADLGPGVLASAGPVYNVINFPGAPEADVLYPAALANALAGEVLFPEEDFDLVVNIGNGIPWYFGLDGNTPAGLFDFVTVALHEAGHGLGFTTVRGYSGGVGSLRSNGLPSVYGLYIVDGDGNLLLDFPDPSTEIGDAFTSGDLFMDGTFAKAALGGERPEIYAPSTFQGGSSIAHWDEGAFPAGDPNSLMTPQVGSAESNFDIGDITRGLFKDMGWVINDADAPLLIANPTSIETELFIEDSLTRFISLSNISDSAVSASISANMNASTIALINPDELSLASTETDSFQVVLSTAGLAKGLYSDTIFVEANDQVLIIPVLVQVLDGTEAPVISVSPELFNETLEQFEITTMPLTISNTGDADLTFNISVTDDSVGGFSAGVTASDLLMSKGQYKVVPFPVAETSSLSALVKGKNTSYNKLATNLYATDFEAFATGDVHNQLGWVSQYSNNWVISSDNPADGSQHLRGVSDGLGSTRNGSILAISPTITPLDEPFMVTTSSVNFSGSGVTWEIIPQSPTVGSVVTRLRFNADGTIDVLTDPAGFVPVDAEIPTGYFDVRIVVDKGDATFSIYFDETLVFSGQGYANIIEQVVYLSAMEVAGPTMDIDNLDITDGDPDAFFLSVSPNSGTVPFGESTVVDVKFDARALEPGEYMANIAITSNDEVNSPIDVPVTLTVVQPPKIVIDPDTLITAVDVVTDIPPTKTETFNIFNTGDSDLEFDISLGAINFTPDLATESISVSSLDMARYGVGNTERPEEKLAGSSVTLISSGQTGNEEASTTSSATFSDSIFYDTGIPFPNNFSGVQTAAYTSAVNFDVESDFTLTAVRNAFRTEAVANPVVILEIYSGGATPNDGELLLQQTVNLASQEGIFALETLDQALSFEAGESFWVVHKYPDGIEFPQGVDDNATQRPNTYFFSSDGGATFSPSGFVFLVRALSGGVDNSYITLEPSSGTVPPGESVEVSVTFDGASLANGTYITNIHVNSNDPSSPLYLVNTIFDVSGQQSQIAISDEYLLFNSVFLGAEADRTFTLSNEGLGQLNVTSISSDNDDFTVDVSSVVLDAGETVEVTVTFAPGSLGSINGLITIESDASNAGTLQVVVNGVGTEPPFVRFDPEEVSATTDAGTTVDASISLVNDGNSPLIFSFPDLTLAAILSQPNVQLNNTERLDFPDFSTEQEKGFKDTRQGSPVLYSVGTDNGYGYSWIDSDEPGGPIYNFTDITASGTEITSLGGDGTAEISLSFPFEFYGGVYASVYVNANGFLAFDVPGSAPWVNTQLPNADATNNIIAGMWTDLEPQNSSGAVHFQDFGDRFIVQWTNSPEYFGSAAETVTFQIVLHVDGNIEVFYEDVETASFRNFATVGIENADGTDGAQVAFNTSYIKDGLALRIVKPSLAMTPFISNVTPASGVVPAGGSRTLTATLDATQLNDGVYYDELTVSSNAPVDTTNTALFELTVVGYPEIQATPNSLTFDPLFIGLSSEADVLIENTGTKALEIADFSNGNGDFVVDTVGPVTLLPNQSLLVGVTFVPSSTGLIEDQLLITSNDAFGNESLVIYLSGIGVDPPVIDVSPDSLYVAIYEGDSTTEVVSITNNGNSDLNYSLTPPYFGSSGEANIEGKQYPKLEFEKIRSKETQDTRVGAKFLNASGGPGTFGYTWIDNNSGGPGYDFIDISGSGEVANVGGDGHAKVALPFTFNFFGTDQDSVTIGANGFLTFAEVVGSNFVNQQIPNTGNPNLFIAPFWSDLEPQNGDGVLYQGNADYFIVQYENVPGWGLPPILPVPDPVTFQVILYPDGSIKMQYENVNSTMRTTSTVGLEGPMGLNGLQVIFNNEYLTEELAITFTPPLRGTVAPGETDEIPITFYSDGIEGGDIVAGDILISSNDPITPEVNVPVILEVLALPEIVSLTLINADINEEIGILNEGDVVDLTNYLNNSFSVVANPDSTEVGSVVFDFNGVENFQTENIMPYALDGDNAGGTEFIPVAFPLGLNTITATPYTKSNGKGKAGKAITVTFEVVESDAPDVCYGGNVVSYVPGNRKNGAALPPSRSNPLKALGAPQENDGYNYVALGFGGYIEIEMECEVTDREGYDVLIVETSFRDVNRPCASYPEKAMVEASEDGINWAVVASEICKDGLVDLADGGLEKASYFRITDISNPGDFVGNSADGYDLDGIVVINNTPDSISHIEVVEEHTDVVNMIADEEDVEISAYPNPVSDYLEYSFNGENGHKIATMYSMKGEVVFQADIEIVNGNDKGRIDMRNFERGIYQLQVINEDGGIVTRIKLLKM